MESRVQDPGFSRLLVIKGGKYHNEELTADHPLVAELGLCTTKESY